MYTNICNCKKNYQMLFQIKKLIKKESDINISTIENMFNYVCTHNHHKIVNWMSDVFKKILLRNINISIIFSSTCCVGNLKIAKILITKFPNINVHITNDYAICMAIHNNHFEMAKWLYDNFKPFNTIAKQRMKRIINKIDL